MAKTKKGKPTKKILSSEKEKILSRIRRMLTLDSDYMDDCYAYEEMDAMSWELPGGLAVHEWVRKRVSTDAHDILKTAINLFDTHNPKWEILPRGPADAEKAEEIERWLEWQMMSANQAGDTQPMKEMLKHASKYGRVAAQIDCLPYWLTKGTDEYKEALAHPFCIEVHKQPYNVHYERGKYGLRWVAPVVNIPAGECVDHWDAYKSDGEYGKKIEAAISKIEGWLEDDEEARIMYVDYTDKDSRWVFAYLAQSAEIDTDLDVTENLDKDTYVDIVDGENPLGFINWAIAKADSDPLLYSMHKGGIWENQNFLDTIADSVIIRRGFFPLIKHKSVSGKPLEVDYTGAEAVVELNAADGEEAEVLSPPPLDSGIRELMDRNSQKAASATGLKGLQNMNVTGNVQFAAVNAQIQVSKSVLDPYLTCHQHASVQLGQLAFMWVKKGNLTLTGYRTKTKDDRRGKVKGEKINISPKDFDPVSMQIQCELLPTTPNDEMQRMNVFSQAVQIGLPLPKKQIVERMGWGEGDVMEQDFFKEKVQEMALAVFQKMQDGQAELMLQQAMMALQQPPPGPPPQSLPPGGQPGMPPPEQMGGAQMMPGGMANDPNSGGLPPAMSSPQETQTQTRRP